MDSLEEVETWFYFLDVNIDEYVIDSIAESEYDMIVVDFISSESNNTDFELEEMITYWHTAEHPKLVIAYIDIGQAEDFRTYWEPDWQIGDPEWIVSGDPDGWEGNYPVAFWWDEYRDIWIGEGGYLQNIIEVGFDGVYLDWVEAYSDESIIAQAESEGLDPLQEMIWWVGDIATFTRSLREGFIVIAQNAAELVEHEAYVEVIDAISQEQVWFDGSAEDDPPGDCPLPRTEQDVESAGYIESLSADCLRLFEEFPDSTLHVSSESYLYYLEIAREAGLVVFTVDYAVEYENIDWVYKTSRSYGFIPFVSNRLLDTYREPDK
jgi:cysteinyl-tRNA synthetase